MSIHIHSKEGCACACVYVRMGSVLVVYYSLGHSTSFLSLQITISSGTDLV